MGGVAGEDEAGLTPPDAEQTDQGAEVQQQAEQTLPSSPGFGERGRMRRRARFLRKARELAYRDLGGLVYDLHRFGQRNDQVVLAKLATLGRIDAELRALEQALHEIKPLAVLHEVGIAACPRCAAIHGHEDRFCPGCGLAFAAGAERPLSTAPVTATATAAAAGAPAAGGPVAATGAPAAKVGRPAVEAGTPAAAAGVTTAETGAPTAVSAPAAEPLTTFERPAPPPSRPTAAPVAARPPAEPEDGRAGNGSKGRDDGKASDYGRPDPEEPTQILRPPAGSA